MPFTIEPIIKLFNYVILTLYCSGHLQEVTFIYSKNVNQAFYNIEPSI